MEENKVATEAQTPTEAKTITEEKPQETKSFLSTHKKQIVGIFVFLIIFTGLMLIAFCRQIFGNEIGDAILGKDVPNGFVAIGKFFIEKKDALIGSLISIFIFFVIYYILSIIIKATLNGSARSRTIGSILRSFIKYLLVVIAIITILALWGVNVAGIFAGVGIAGLIIGLGCKTIVNDIVSGFFIVIDDYYQVGDKIEVNGFEGDVISIGLRTTKIKDGLKIKSICNSQISSVINISKGTSTCKAKICISYTEDIRRVEAVIAKNLSHIKKRLPALLEDIKYKGICEINDYGPKLEFSSKVSDDDKGQIEKNLLRELYLMFVDNDIEMPFNKEIVVNTAKTKKRPTASKEDIKLSNALIQKVNPKKEEVVAKQSGLIQSAVNTLNKNLK